MFVLALCFFIASVLHAAQPIDPDTRWLFAKAVQCLDEGDYGCAKLKLGSVLERSPQFGEAYFLKAMLLYHDGKIEEGNRSWRQAIELDPSLSKQIQQGWERRAHGIESHLTQQNFSHFNLQFNGAENREKAWQAVQYLNEAYNELGSRFGVFPTAHIPVIVFTTMDFIEAWNAPFWLGGFFDKRDGKVRLRVDDPPGGDAEFRRRARHEFTHAFIYQLYPHDLPVWFQEGAAQFYAYANPSDSFWKENRLSEIRQLVRGKPWLTMEQIERAIAKKNVPPIYIYLSYLESEAMTLAAAKQRGDSWIPNCLTLLRSGSTFEAAFRETTGTTPAEALEHLHKEWQ